MLQVMLGVYQYKSDRSHCELCNLCREYFILDKDICWNLDMKFIDIQNHVASFQNPLTHEILHKLNPQLKNMQPLKIMNEILSYQPRN